VQRREARAEVFGIAGEVRRDDGLCRHGSSTHAIVAQFVHPPTPLFASARSAFAAQRCACSSAQRAFARAASALFDVPLKLAPIRLLCLRHVYHGVTVTVSASRPADAPCRCRFARDFRLSRPEPATTRPRRCYAAAAGYAEPPRF